jgi:hypothetical protein
LADKNGRFAPLYRNMANLCRVMEIKYDLSLRTRRAYESGDLEALRRLAKEDYAAVLRRVERFAKALERQWMRENKPCGFDVQHRRLGGLLLRTRACRARLLDYVCDRVPSIPELEEELLPFGSFGCGESIDVYEVERHTTPNVR